MIPAGNYGAGAMIVWDQGAYRTHRRPCAGRGPRGGQARSRARGAQAARSLGAGAHPRRQRQGLAAAAQGEPAAGAPDPVRDAAALDPLRAHGRGAARGDDARRGARSGRRRGCARRGATCDRAALRPMLATPADAAFSRRRLALRAQARRRARARGEARATEYTLLARTGGDSRAHLSRDRRARSRACRSRASSIDGEIVALDECGTQLLRAPAAALAPRRPRGDRAGRGRGAGRLLRLRSARARWASTRAELPLAERKQLLARFVPSAGLVRYSDHIEGDGERALRGGCRRAVSRA